MSDETTDDVGPARPSAIDWLKPAVVVALGVAALVATVILWTGVEESSALTVANHVEIRVRWIALVVAACAALLVVGAVFAPGCGGRVARFDFASTLCAPLLIAPFVPALFSIDAWQGREIGYLCYLLIVALALERLLRPFFGSLLELPKLRAAWERVCAAGLSPWLRWMPWAALAAIVALYVVRVGTLTNVSHVKMATMSSDLAEFDNLFFNALSGHPFRAPAIEGDLQDFSALKVHAEFGIWLLLPFYAISPGPEALLWIQTSLVALTAVPIFLFARRCVGVAGGLVFASSYLMMPAVQRPNFYDFHFTPLGMFLVSWVFLFAFDVAASPTSKKAKVGLYGAFTLALLSREDISIGLFVLGVFLVLQGRLVRYGLVFAAVSAVYFVTIKFFVMPAFGEMWFDTIYQDLKAQGAEGFGAVIVTLLTNPAHALRAIFIEPKFLYLLHMAVPLLGLWLRRPIFWLAVLPGFVSTLLVTNRAPMFQTSFQYTYLWVPYVVAASVLALRGLKNRAPALCALVMVAGSLDHQLGVVTGGEQILGGFRVKTFEVSDVERQRIKQLRELVATIPKDASVAATEAEGPHVSTRLVMYSLKFTLGHEPEYLLVGRPGLRGETIHIRQALESGQYGVVATKGPFTLAKRGADTGRNRLLWRKVGGRPPRGRPGQR